MPTNMKLRRVTDSNVFQNVYFNWRLFFLHRQNRSRFSAVSQPPFQMKVSQVHLYVLLSTTSRIDTNGGFQLPNLYSRWIAILSSYAIFYELCSRDELSLPVSHAQHGHSCTFPVLIHQRWRSMTHIATHP